MVGVTKAWQRTDDDGNITTMTTGGGWTTSGGSWSSLPRRLDPRSVRAARSQSGPWLEHPRKQRRATGERSEKTRTRLLLVVVVTAILISVVNQTFVNVVVPDIQKIRGDAGAGRLGHHGLPAGVRRRHSALRAHRRPVQPAPHVRRWPRPPCRRLASCALAPTLPLLVAGRIVQAVGASAIPALGFAAVAKALAGGRAGHGARVALGQRRRRRRDRTRLRWPHRGLFGMARVVLIDAGFAPSA